MASGLSIVFLGAVLITSTISGIFGMAGGLILMGVLTLILPVSAAFVTHGILQLAANGWRAVLHRRHVDWVILGFHAVGSAIAAAIVLSIAYVPSKPLVFLLLGLVPAFVWLPRSWLQLDASRPLHSVISGFCVTGISLLSGVGGPLLDIFFVRTRLTRHQIVATKAATQVLSHAIKILVFGIPMLTGRGDGMPPLSLLALAIPLSMAGTALGGAVLDRMSDQTFLKWTRLIVTAVGTIYLWQAGSLLIVTG